PGQGGADRPVLGVTRGVRLDGGRRGLQGEVAELADAGVELLVAGPQAGHARRAERVGRVGQDLADDPAVVLVVVRQPGRVDQGRPDVGLVDPGALGAAVGHDDLPAVRPGRVRAVGRRGAIETEVPDTGAGEGRVVRVDLGGVVTVVVGELRVDRHARRAA